MHLIVHLTNVINVLTNFIKEEFFLPFTDFENMVQGRTYINKVTAIGKIGYSQWIESTYETMARAWACG